MLGPLSGKAFFWSQPHRDPEGGRREGVGGLNTYKDLIFEEV